MSRRKDIKKAYSKMLFFHLNQKKHIDAVKLLANDVLITGTGVCKYDGSEFNAIHLDEYGLWEQVKDESNDKT